MADFSVFKKLEVEDGKTAVFKIHEITVNGHCPSVIVAPATEHNPQYFNAVLKRTGKSARAIRAGALSKSMLDENREDDRALYPKYVIKGWDVKDPATGNDVPFSEEEATKFLEAIPNWIFDDMRNFAANVNNFTDSVNVEVKAKN